MHQREHSDDDAECSKSYFQKGRASILLTCCLFGLTVEMAVNNADQNKNICAEKDRKQCTKISNQQC